MRKELISTSIGDIMVYINEVPETIPLFLLHGVYFDYNLWTHVYRKIKDHTVVLIDMPLHGASQNITKPNWQMEDCAHMLIDIIDHYQFKEVFAIGHSWGSMTILRAAAKSPEKFKTVGFCNMPFEQGSFKTKIQFSLQHWALYLRKFYTQQVMKAMFSEESRKQKPEICKILEQSIHKLSRRSIMHTDKAVISHVDSGLHYLDNLRVPALALKGSEDYVGNPDNIPMTVVQGRHVSPLEEPEAVFQFVRKVLEL